MLKVQSRILACLIVLGFVITSSQIWGQGIYPEWNISFGDGWIVAPRVHDLDMDGTEEIVALASGAVPTILRLDHWGSIEWQVALRDAVEGSIPVGIAFGDLNRDYKYEIVAATSHMTGSLVCALKYDGQMMWQLPLEGLCTSPPVVVDLNWDGYDEILIVDEGRGLICIKGMTGEISWIVEKRMATKSFVTVADLERSGKMDVIWFQNKTQSVQFIDGPTGKILRTLQKTNGQSYVGWPMIADLDADGRLDLVIQTPERVICIDPIDLTTKWTFDQPSRFPGALGDVDGDGLLEVLVPGEGVIVCITADGSLKYRTLTESKSWMGSIVLGDVDGDGVQEALSSPDRTQIIHGFSSETGMLKFSFSSFLGGIFDGNAPPALSDGDGDGTVEIYCGVTGKSPAPFYALAATAKGTSRLDWPQYLHDWRNTGNYETAMKMISEWPFAALCLLLLCRWRGAR